MFIAYYVNTRTLISSRLHTYASLKWTRTNHGTRSINNSQKQYDRETTFIILTHMYVRNRYILFTNTGIKNIQNQSDKQESLT